MHLADTFIQIQVCILSIHHNPWIKTVTLVFLMDFTELQFKEIQQVMAFWKMKCSFSFVSTLNDFYTFL